MCGIFGAFDFAGKLDPASLDAMQAALAHRGPDDVGYHRDGHAAIGNRRLSIIDIAGGHQPMLSADGAIAVVQNGEIFNYRELQASLREQGVAFDTNSDTEVILRLYEKEGANFVRHLNGMFAIAIWDRRDGSLFLYRDRMGVKPLYFGEQDGVLFFASEIKAILAAGFRREVDFTALHHFLSFNYVPPPVTMFKGVSHIMPGEQVRVTREGLERRYWWRLADVRTRTGRSESALCDEVLGLLDDATRLRLRADVPVGAFLSGGIDSSAVVGMMSRHLDEVLTFNIGFDDARFDEAPFAAAVAQAFGTRHVSRRVNADMASLWPLATYFCDQPHGDVSFMPTYLVSALAAEQLKVVLTGDGGDELFAGYDKYKSFFQDGSGDSPTGFQRAYFDSISLLGEEDKHALYGSDLKSALVGLDTFDTFRHVFDEAEGFDPVNQALYVDSVMLLPGNNLVKPDRMGMAVSLEARTPFLDYRMVEFAMSIPGEFKLRNGETKYILKKALAPMLGDDIVYRKKQMFTVPIGEWMRGALAEYMRSVLSGSRARARGWFDATHVEQMIEAHVAGRANHTRILRALVAIEIWARMFLDDFHQTVPSGEDLGIHSAAA